MPCTSFSKALIVLGVSWSMSKLESLSSLLESLVSLSESLSLSLSLVSTSASTAACSFLVKVVLVVLSLSEMVCLRLVIVKDLVLVVVGLVLVVVAEEGGRDGGMEMGKGERMWMRCIEVCV